MSQFPNPDNYSKKKSNSHLSFLSINNDSLIIKKNKEIYLYDIDNNKYIDFYLQNGTIFDSYSPSRLSNFQKNALSSGMNIPSGYNKFLYKATKYWTNIINQSPIRFYSSFLSNILAIINTSPNQPITIGYNSSYIYSLLYPLKNIITCVDTTNSVHKVDILIFEEFNDNFEKFDHRLINTQTKVEIHSRFLFRGIVHHIPEFSPETFHMILKTSFGGKDICLIAGMSKLDQEYLSFEDGILFLEGAKYFNKLSQLIIPKFQNPLFNSFYGFAQSKIDLDHKYFLERGIFIKDNLLFFSPLHSIYNLKYLSKVLNEYFSHYSVDILAQR